MPTFFLPYEPRQTFLLPPSPSEATEKGAEKGSGITLSTINFVPLLKPATTSY
jgi:hypothetical protein